MPDHGAIYARQAERYHELIAKQPSLESIIEEIRPVAGLDVVDLGAGSGRLAAVLAGQARSIVALDAQAAMLEVAAKRLSQAGYTNWSTSVADHRSLPLENDSADLVVSGWSIGYLGSDTLPGWEDDIRLVISEIKRVLRPGGTAIILETMGTGFETPNPPPLPKTVFQCAGTSLWLLVPVGAHGLRIRQRGSSRTADPLLLQRRACRPNSRGAAYSPAGMRGHLVAAALEPR